MRVKVLTLLCIALGTLALANGKSINKENGDFKNLKPKEEIDKERHNEMAKENPETSNENSDSKNDDFKSGKLKEKVDEKGENHQKEKDPCVCDGNALKASNQGLKKSKCTSKCSSSCKENKKCVDTGKRSECKTKDVGKKCPCKSQGDSPQKCKNVQTSEGKKKCNCNCKDGEEKRDTRQFIPKPAAAATSAAQPMNALAPQHGIGKKVNSSKKCCCDCCHDCCCDCCHDCCCDCCHDCCHDCCCHCCEPCCCCCHCCEPCCCCCHCCEPCCCHCCHCCHHCPCCCGCGCGCCKKSKSQLNNAALATAAALAANHAVHH